MSRAESALEALYEDASLRDELRDDEANELLKWAESELVKLDESGADDEAFEEKVGQLRRLIRGMNRFVGRRAEISAQADDQTLVKMSEQADALGYTLSPEQLVQYGAKQALMDGVSAIQGLTRLISGGTSGDAPAEAQQSAPPPTESPEAAPPAGTEQTPPTNSSQFTPFFPYVTGTPDAASDDTLPTNLEETDQNGT